MCSYKPRASIIAILCALALFAILLSNINSTQALLTNPTEDETTSVPSIGSITRHLDYSIALGLSEMANGAEIIVIGEYTGLDSTWNMSRNPRNPDEESNKNYVEGLLYNFSVHEVLKGELDSDTILVNHRHSETKNMPISNAELDAAGVIVKEATEWNEVRLTLEDPLYIEPEENATYILFLQENKNRNHYYGAAEPFSIKVTDGVAALQSNLVGHTDAFTQTVTLDNGQTVDVTTEIGTIEDTISGQTLEEVTEAILTMGEGGTQP